MSNLKSIFGSDANLEQSGVWVEYGDEISILIARAGGRNVKYNKLLEAKMKPHRRAIQTQSLDAKIADKLVQDVYAETIILAWKGVHDDDGEDIPCTPDNIRMLFQELPDFFQEIRIMADSIALFRDEEEEQDAGN